MKSLFNNAATVATLGLVSAHSHAFEVVKVVPVSEPSSIALLGAGLALIALSRKGKK